MGLQKNNLVLYLNTRSLLLERNQEFNAARKAGLDVVIVAPSAAPYRNYKIEHFIETPLGNYKIAQEAIINYLRSNNLKITGVVAWGDKEVELAARVGTTLGLASTPVEASRNVRNKARTRQLLEQLGAVNPKYAIIRDYKSFREGLEAIGVPCLLKPSGASGGRGIFKIDSYENADSIFKEFIEYCVPSRDEIYSYFSEKLLLEENLSGTEHSIAGIVADNQVILLAIADKKIDKKVPFQYQNIIPSKLSYEIQNKVKKIATYAVKLMGINWCGFHIDFIVNEQGIKILEIGGRLGGECINSHLIPLSYSQLHPYDLLLQVVQGNNPFTKSDFIHDSINQAGLRAFFPANPGRIVRLEGLEKVKNHSSTREFLQLKQLNDRVVLPSVQMDGYAVAYVVAQCDSLANMENILEETASLVRIETE